MADQTKAKKRTQLEEFKAAVLFAKEQRLLNFKFGEFEGQFHPMAFLEEMKPSPHLPPEEMERRRKLEEEELLYRSA